jgi:gliding motility-associated-like protein
MFRNFNFLSAIIFIAILISFNNAFAQPANDNCFGATLLTPSVTCIPITGTVANATQSLAGCAGTADDDVWYSFVATQTSLAVQVSGSAGFNPVIQVFSAGCSSLSSLTCANSSSSLNEIAVLNTLLVGVTYWIRVYHFAATVPTTPTFTICISPQPVMPNCAVSTPAGNTCADAALICDVNGYCGSTSAAYTPDGWPALSTAFCGSIENDSYIQFVANASTVSLNVWVTSSASNLGIQVLIFSTSACGGPVTAYTCVSPLAPSAAAQGITATGLIPGNTYYMMIDGFAGDVCNYVIGVNSGIQVSGQITTSATNVCLGNPVTLNASGGNGVYSWTPNPDLSATSGAVIIANPTSQGPHVYTMTTNSTNPFCPSTSISNITINAFAPPTPNAGIDDTVCLGNPIYLAGAQTSVANSMSWQTLTAGILPVPIVSFSPNFSNLNPTVTVNQPGLYQFVLRETNSVCGINRDTVRVLVVQQQQSVNTNSPSCFGLADGQITIVNPTATQYSFDNGITWGSNATLTGLASGNYTVCSRDYLGCSVCSSVTIVNPIPLQLSVSNDTTICENGSADLLASAIGGNAFLYHWDFTSNQANSQIVSPTINSQYIVYAENEFGCLSLPDTISISVLPGISGLISPNSSVCPGFASIINVSASGGNNGPYNFNWSSGQTNLGLASNQTFSPASPTTYVVTITDGCESTPLVLYSIIDVLPLPIPSISTLDTAICEPANFVVFNTTNPNFVDHLEWQVSNGEQFIDQESIQLNALSAGIYSIQLTVTTPQGCVDSAMFTNFLTVYPVPVAEFGYNPNPVKMFNPTVQLTNYSSNGVSYEWFITEGNPSYSQSQHVQTSFPDGEVGNYEVLLIATSEYGCIDTTTHIVLVLPEIILYVPNTFTPNTDEFNSQWEIHMEGLDIYNFELLVYNRWGQVVWESRNPDESWDGTYKGEIVQDGTYTWTIKGKDIYSDDMFTYNGYVNVLK